MNARMVSFSAVAGLMVCLAFSLAATSVAAADANELVGNSPFLPEGWQPPPDRTRPTPPPVRPQTQPGAQPLDAIEFRGMTKFDGQVTFSIYNPAEKRSYWIGLGQSDGGFSVVEFKEREDAIVVSHDGKTRTVSLHQAKVGVLAPDAPTPPRAREAQPGGREPAAQPENPEERMQNLAEEIRRRREIRRALVEEAEANQP